MQRSLEEGKTSKEFEHRECLYYSKDMMHRGQIICGQYRLPLYYSWDKEDEDIQYCCKMIEYHRDNVHHQAISQAPVRSS